MLKTKSAKEVSRIGFAGYQGREIADQDLAEILDNREEVNLFRLSEPGGFSLGKMAVQLDKFTREDVYIIAGSKKRSPATLDKDVSATLDGLKTDYIDLLEFNNVKRGFDHIALLEEGGALDRAVELKKEGKILSVGVSTHDIGLAMEMSEDGRIDQIIVPYNPFEWSNKDLIKDLTGRVSLTADTLWAGKDTVELEKTLAFALKEDFFDHFIFNLKDKEELDILKSVYKNDINLSPEDEKNLVELYEEMEEGHCRQCGACIPCTVHMDILENLKINEMIKKGDYSAIERFESDEINAKDCIKCGACELRCPYKVPVRQKHMETVRMIEEYKNENPEK